MQMGFMGTLSRHICTRPGHRSFHEGSASVWAALKPICTSLSIGVAKTSALHRLEKTWLYMRGAFSLALFKHLCTTLGKGGSVAAARPLTHPRPGTSPSVQARASESQKRLRSSGRSSKRIYSFKPPSPSTYL